MSSKTALNLTKEDRLKLLEKQLQSSGIDSTYFKDGNHIGITEFLPTGQVEIDAILGVGGGLPRGTLVEFAGDYQSGKSYLAMKVMAEAQKRKEWVCYVNVENSFYPPRAVDLGMDLTDPYAFRILEGIDTAEAYGEAIYNIVESGLYSVVVVDSISMMTPETEFEKSLDDVATLGAQARFTKRFMKKLLNKCLKTQTIVIVINQLYLGQGKMPGQMVKTASGGKAAEYIPHVRLWFEKINGAEGKVLDQHQNVIGANSRVTLMKTRYSEPMVVTKMPIMFGTTEGDPVAEFIFRAKSRGVELIEEKRKILTYKNTETGEIASSKDPRVFIKELFNINPPSVLRKGEESKNAFEHIAFALKMSKDQIDKLIQALDAPQEDTDDSEEE